MFNYNEINFDDQPQTDYFKFGQSDTHQIFQQDDDVFPPLELFYEFPQFPDGSQLNFSLSGMENDQIHFNFPQIDEKLNITGQLSKGQTLAETDFQKNSIQQPYNSPLDPEKSKKIYFKISKSPQMRKPSQLKIKNECRYITNVVISNLKKKEYFSKLQSFANGDEEVVNQTTLRFTQIKQQISGFQTLKDQLIVNESDDSLEASTKVCFRKFMIWFLENRYIRYIISKGKMDEAQKYITYKNTVMLKNLKNINSWKSNKPSQVSKNSSQRG